MNRRLIHGILLVFLLTTVCLGSVWGEEVEFQTTTKYFRVSADLGWADDAKLNLKYLDGIYEYLSGMYGFQINQLTVKFQERPFFIPPDDNKVIYIYSPGIQLQLITHELAHVFQRTLWKDCPVWLSEAQADYLKDLRFGFCSYYTVYRTYNAGQFTKITEWGDFNRLIRGYYGPHNSNRYGETVLVFMREVYGEDKSLEWLWQMLSTFSIEKACRKVFGKTESVMFNEWKTWVTSSSKTSFEGMLLYDSWLPNSKELFSGWADMDGSYIGTGKLPADKYKIVFIVASRKNVELLKQVVTPDFPGLLDFLKQNSGVLRVEKVGTRWNVYIIGDNPEQIIDAFMGYNFFDLVYGK